jgi:hypothetical protein
MHPATTLVPRERQHPVLLFPIPEENSLAVQSATTLLPRERQHTVLLFSLSEEKLPRRTPCNDVSTSRETAHRASLLPLPRKPPRRAICDDVHTSRETAHRASLFPCQGNRLVVQSCDNVNTSRETAPSASLLPFRGHSLVVQSATTLIKLERASPQSSSPFIQGAQCFSSPFPREPPRHAPCDNVNSSRETAPRAPLLLSRGKPPRRAVLRQR